MKTVMLVFGTRPEAIKMAPLVKEFQKHPESFKTVVCVTGQHRQMLDQVLQLFEITPDYDLNIMKQGQDLYDVTARVLVGMRDVLKETQPDVVLVHGDTTTSTAAALAAFYQQIPVGHVEAGLRTHNIYSPWPEEMNRQITSRIATYNFAPTPLSKANLLREAVAEESITVTGNTVIDALYSVVDKIKENTALNNELQTQLAQAGYDVNRLADGKKLVLITGHRRENFGDGFINMCTAIKDLTQKYPDVDFVYPMHLNPNVRKPIAEVFGPTPSLPSREGEKSCYQTADPTLYGLLKDFAKENKDNATDAEVALWSFLRDEQLGSKFRRQHIIDKYIADFVCLEKQLVVEVDGAYHSELKQIEYDKDRTTRLNEFGFKVIRFTNEEAIANTEECINKIKSVLISTPSPMERVGVRPSSPTGGGQVGANMFFIEPLEYLSFVYMMEKSTIVLTDSGGIQEEAPGLGKPVLVMRDTTERPEALEAGTVKLVGTNYDKIVAEVSALLDDQIHYDSMSKAVNPYGDGLACGRIVEALR
ncbi:MAG: UDP-N-acetylglucosamine 2-epimerase (non-hydrolyzing) [Bacteroidaceae bacterium]|nr:UDP-N-acetylglucosamine 2-epimerase (non-hydrolyzing) [Bacteroidaceae bacterium]